MKNKLTYSIAALIIVIILGSFLAYGYYQKCENASGVYCQRIP